jgi:hypothetical protein
MNPKRKMHGRNHEGRRHGPDDAATPDPFTVVDEVLGGAGMSSGGHVAPSHVFHPCENEPDVGLRPDTDFGLSATFCLDTDVGMEKMNRHWIWT